MAVTGIILAGGKSTRMGKDKGLVLLEEKTLAAIIIEKMAGVCDRILISSNSMDYQDFELEVIPDHYPGIGPMGGIHASLKSSFTELNLVISVDMPFVNRGLMDYLIKNSQGYQITVPWAGGEHFEPLCACYQRSILPVLEQFISRGNFKMPDVFRTVFLNPLEIGEDLPFFHPWLFHNINSEEDLKKAERILGNGNCY